MTGTYDFLTLLGHVITSRSVPCESLRLATLAFSSRNTAELVQLLDGGAVRRVSLLCSDYFAKHNKAEFAEAVQEFRARGMALAAPRCHAKVTCLHFADGAKLVFEGSANLRTNGNIEQFASSTTRIFTTGTPPGSTGSTVSGKASKAEVAQRVEAVFELRLGGAGFADIREYARAPTGRDGEKLEPWGVSDSQQWRYIAKADALCKDRCDARADHLLARHLLRRERLYAHCTEVGDYKTALAVLKDEAQLEGVYEARDKPQRPQAGECEAEEAPRLGTGDVVSVLSERLSQVGQADLPTAEKARLTAALADALLRALGVDDLEKRLAELERRAEAGRDAA